MPNESSKLVQSFNARFAQDPQFSSLSFDGVEVGVYWFGEPSTELREFIEQSGQSVSFKIYKAVNPPDQVRDAARVLWDSPLTPALRTLSIAEDSSKITVEIDPGLTETETQNLEQKLTSIAGFPVEVLEGGVAPAK